MKDKKRKRKKNLPSWARSIVIDNKKWHYIITKFPKLIVFDEAQNHWEIEISNDRYKDYFTAADVRIAIEKHFYHDNLNEITLNPDKNVIIGALYTVRDVGDRNEGFVLDTNRNNKFENSMTIDMWHRCFKKVAPLMLLDTWVKGADLPSSKFYYKVLFEDKMDVIRFTYPRTWNGFFKLLK